MSMVGCGDVVGCKVCHPPVMDGPKRELSFFDVHVWADSGRIMTINHESWGQLMISWLDVTVSGDQLDAATYVLCEQLVKGTGARVYEHKRDGEIISWRGRRVELQRVRSAPGKGQVTVMV